MPSTASSSHLVSWAGHLWDPLDDGCKPLLSLKPLLQGLKAGEGEGAAHYDCGSLLTFMFSVV